MGKAETLTAQADALLLTHGYWREAKPDDWSPSSDALAAGNHPVYLDDTDPRG